MEHLLPIGSVVLLDGGEKPLMIIGIGTKDQDDGAVYDYIGCLHPEGFIDSETFFMFNQQDIAEVRFIGFVNAETQLYMEMVREGMTELKEE